MQTAAAILAFLLLLTIGFVGLTLLLWWLVPLAFPALVFGPWNAMALSGLTLIFAGMASTKVSK